VIEHHISDYFDGKSYIAVMSIGDKLSDKQQKKMVLHAERILGAGFNWKGIFFFWLSIISGNNEHFRVCCVADIIILIVSLMGIFYKILILRYVFLALGVLYLLVVVFSRVRMKMFKKKCIEYPDTKEAKKEYVVGKNLIDDLIELSLEDLEKYFGLFEKDFADIPEAVIAACNNVANKLVKIDEFTKAEMLYKKALKYCKTSTPKGKMDAAGVLNNLAGVYVERKQHDKAKQTIREAIELIKNLNTNEAKIFYTRLHGNINLLNHRIDRESRKEG
jgi:tetratricopeptide (TPR) repeat protein